MQTKSIMSWLVTSSQNPENYSLFLKSAVAMSVLFGFDQAIVGEAGDLITTTLIAVGMLISAVTGLMGLFRKVRLGRWSAI
jgi:hypothetical protein